MRIAGFAVSTVRIHTSLAASTRTAQIRMRSGSDKLQVVSVDFVDQEPIRLDVAIAEMLPFAAERWSL